MKKNHVDGRLGKISLAVYEEHSEVIEKARKERDLSALKEFLEKNCWRPDRPQRFS